MTRAPSGRLLAVPLFLVAVVSFLLPAFMFHGTAPRAYQIVLLTSPGIALSALLTAIAGAPGPLRTWGRWAGFNTIIIVAVTGIALVALAD